MRIILTIFQFLEIMKDVVLYNIERELPMIKMIKSYLDKLSFLKKLRLISNVIIIIPILFLEGFIIYSSGTFIREQQILEVEGTINRNILDIENRMVQCENSLRYLVSNYSLQEFLNTNQNKYLELNSKAK